eukprot:2888249-Pleurochrysis_carterae.AAC.5
MRSDAANRMRIARLETAQAITGENKTMNFAHSRYLFETAFGRRAASCSLVQLTSHQLPNGAVPTTPSSSCWSERPAHRRSACDLTSV